MVNYSRTFHLEKLIKRILNRIIDMKVSASESAQTMIEIKIPVVDFKPYYNPLRSSVGQKTYLKRLFKHLKICEKKNQV